MLFYLSMISDPRQRADFEQVFKDYHNACINEALKHTGRDQYLAEDAVHNAIVKILEKYPEYLKDSCSKLKATFVLIVRNEAISLMRREKIRRHETLDEDSEAASVEDVPLQAIFDGSETY